MDKDYDFIGPPTIWVIFTVIGGITTAVGLIIALEYADKRLSPKPSTTKPSTTVQSSLTMSRESYLGQYFLYF